jgi:hypothetical protein|uniref:XPG-I domain-containing protein n=1 Tax=viral metagenome TaxID=1070528 RepID=A0A6C0HEQ8_9ZZZZ
MGVRGLQSFVRKYSTHKTLNDLLEPSFQKQRIGIDISYYIYKWQGDIERIVQFIQTLQGNKHRIILGFDGRAEDGKQWEAQRRRNAREEEMKSAQNILTALDEATDEMSDEQRRFLEQKALEHQKRGWSITREIRTNIKKRFYEEKIPMVKAKSEADGLLASMAANGILDIVISGDMDLLAMGANVLWTPLDDGLSFNEYNRESIINKLSLGDYQFRSMCAMCFTEASADPTIFDIRQAYQAMRLFRSISVIQKKHSEWLKTWPDQNHIFYRSIQNPEDWLREDQVLIYKAFINCDPMPYT